MKINEHDMTKRMMDVMRHGLLKEDDSEGNDVITPTSNSPEYKEEAKKLADSVDPRVQITKFKIYPRDRDVQFEGRLDSGINFFMSTKAMKLKISITDENGQAIQIYMDSQLLQTVQKLLGYYENWNREWAQKLTTDYQASNL
jgi:hypothetical protein